MSIFGGISKIAGGIGLVLVAYDSHKAGIFRSEVNVKETKSDSLSKHYVEDLSSESPSVTKTKLREKILRFRTDENISSFFTGFSGYIKGFGAMLVHNAIPLVLSLGAVCTKGVTSKFFGAGLVVYGGVIFAQELFGIGKQKSE